MKRRERRRFYVYVYKRPWSERVCYVGKGRGRRWLKHEKLGINHPNPFFAKLYVKAAGRPFIKEKVAEHLTEQEAFILERKLIQEYGRFPNGPLVNLTDGGEGPSGFVMSEKSKHLLSLANLGKTIPLETRLKISKSLKGRPSPMKGRIQSLEHRQKGAASRLGSHRSEETKRKMSVSAVLVRQKRNWSGPFKGQHRSEETKQKISATLSLYTGWRHSEETKRKMSASAYLRHQNRKTKENEL